MPAGNKRKQTQEQKRSALGALTDNPQFTNPRVWTKIDPKILDKIEKAIDKSHKLILDKQIKAKQRELDKLKQKQSDL